MFFPLREEPVFRSPYHRRTPEERIAAISPLDGSKLRQSFTSALKAAQIADLHFHDLRHTFATRLVQGGVDLYKVQRLLGHKSPSMTQRYAHHYPESLRDGVEVLDRRRTVRTISAQRLIAPTVAV